MKIYKLINNFFVFSTLFTFALPANARYITPEPVPPPSPFFKPTVISGNIYLEHGISDCTKINVSLYQYPINSSESTAVVINSIQAFGDYGQNNHCSYKIETSLRAPWLFSEDNNYYIGGYYDQSNPDYQLGATSLGTTNDIYDKTIYQDLYLS